MDEVLTSVQKTEESLRRLKTLRDKSGIQNTVERNQGILADDDKIRAQLFVDVLYWTREIEALGINGNDVERLHDLAQLVDSFKKLIRS